MAINCYLAMTAAEIHRNPQLPPHIGWMACHFSPYGLGLSNLPDTLPESSLLILNDRIPICGHDSQIIARQLAQCAAQTHCSGILLDFQRTDEPETEALKEHLLKASPCPIAVALPYAAANQPVFLPPVPMDTPIESYLAPWRGREIWLEVSSQPQCLRLTPEGCFTEAAGKSSSDTPLLHEPGLHCHYKIEPHDNSVDFHFLRTREDLESLLADAENLGVTRAVGLWQELREK